jgi:3-oxoacyl-[acyl-carrier protein] reductase
MISAWKAVVITGGTKGVGRAVAEHLARIGYDLALSYSSDDVAAQETGAAIPVAGGDCVIVRGDGRRRDSVEELFTKPRTGSARSTP